MHDTLQNRRAEEKLMFEVLMKGKHKGKERKVEAGINRETGVCCMHWLE